MNKQQYLAEIDKVIADAEKYGGAIAASGATEQMYTTPAATASR